MAEEHERAAAAMEAESNTKLQEQEQMVDALKQEHDAAVAALKEEVRLAKVEHEATTSKIGEDQIFYCNARGIETQDAVNMIVNGFCKEVLQALPMEFAMEAQQLVAISLEGSVG